MQLYQIQEKELHKEQKLLILLMFPISFLIFGIGVSVYQADFNTLAKGVVDIIVSPTILLTDFLAIGGIGAAFVNAAVIGFFNLYLLAYYKLRINGLLIAAFMTVIGFAFFGKNLFNVIPIYLGGYMYTKYQRIAFKDSILVIMFATALAPIISEISFGDILPTYIALPFGIIVGIFIGFIIVPLSTQMLKFHDGFNLYNIGFASGILGTVLTSIFRSFKIEIEPVSIIYKNNSWLIVGLLIFLFCYLMIIGLYVNRHVFKHFTEVFKYKGRLVTDFTHLVGYGITFFNMGMMGLLCIIYVIMVKGVINGPVMAGIFTVVGFSAFGKHLKNCFPIVLGVFITSLVLGYDLSSTGMIISLLFSTTLAPIAGSYGIGIGIVAGMMHLMLVTNVGVIHGGINLYNNGFAGGIVAGFIIPIVDAFKRE